MLYDIFSTLFRDTSVQEDACCMFLRNVVQHFSSKNRDIKFCYVGIFNDDKYHFDAQMHHFTTTTTTMTTV